MTQFPTISGRDDKFTNCINFTGSCFENPQLFRALSCHPTHHGWATKRIFHFLQPQNTLKRYSIGEKNKKLILTDDGPWTRIETSLINILFTIINMKLLSFILEINLFLSILFLVGSYCKRLHSSQKKVQHSYVFHYRFSGFEFLQTSLFMLLVWINLEAKEYK